MKNLALLTDFNRIYRYICTWLIFGPLCTLLLVGLLLIMASCVNVVRLSAIVLHRYQFVSFAFAYNLARACSLQRKREIT